MAGSVGASAIRPSSEGAGALQRIPFLADAPREARVAFARAARVARFKSGACFLREGETCAHFAIVLSGRIRVFKPAERGHEITFYSVGPGEACPLNAASILSSRPACAMSRAEEPVEAIVIPAPAFRAMIAEHEGLRSFVFRTLAARLSEAMCLAGEIAFHRIGERLARRVENLLDHHRGLRASVDITHAKLAADLGTAREVVSRRLKQLERQGAIALSRGRIELRNAERLRAMSWGGSD